MSTLVGIISKLTIGRTHIYPVIGRFQRQVVTSFQPFHSSPSVSLSAPVWRKRARKRTPVNLDGNSETWELHRKVITTYTTAFFGRKKKVSFDVGYVDTGEKWSLSKKQTTPTVVAVHGSPATHTDVLPVVSPCHDLGYRVVAVNLPGYGITPGVTKEDNEMFNQSTTEIAEFLLDFLNDIHVNDVTMLVGHSGGSLPVTVLAVLSDLVRSVMLICPPPGHARTAAIEPAWIYQAVVAAYGYTLGRLILRPLLPIVNKISVGLQSNRPSHLRNTLRYISNIDYALLRETAKNLNSKKIPTLYVCSQNDSLIQFKLSLKWAAMLGVPREFFDEYDADFKLRKQASDSRTEHGYKKGVILARGGHFPQFKTNTALPILVAEAQHMLQIALHEQDSDMIKTNSSGI